MFNPDQAQFELEAEFNARYDYIHEAYHDLGDNSITLRFEAQARWEDDMIDAQDMMEARGGPVFSVPFDWGF